MKRHIRFFLQGIAMILCAAACDMEEREEVIKDPIAFTANMPDITVVEGEDHTYSWHEGDKVGIFVGPTREMVYHIDATAKSAGLAADMADIPAHYGDIAYAYYPGTGNGPVFVDTKLSVPDKQTFKDGHNINALNMAAIAYIEDAAATLDFKHLGAMLDLGLSSENEITLGSIKVEATKPASGSFLSGNVKIDFSGEEPELDMKAIENGANTVIVTFPDHITLSNATQYISVGVLPFATTGDGLSITLYDTDGNPCPLQPILTDADKIGSNGAISLAAGQCARYNVGQVSSDQFLRPSEITIKVIDDKTGTIRPDQEIEVYSVLNGSETFIEKLTTDIDGNARISLSIGDYKVYTSYNDAIPKEYNSMSFSVAANNPATEEFKIYPYLFVDDFSWILPDMGKNYTLKPYYDIAKNTVNNASDPWNDCNQTFQDILKSKGWTLSQWVYPRPGEMTIGKKNATSTIETPKLTGLTGTSDVEITIVAIPYHTIKEGKWTLERSQIRITVNGGGTINGNTTLLEKEFESGGQEHPDKPTEFKHIISGATSQTSITISNEKPGDVTGSMWRCLVDEVRILEKY